MKFIHDTALVLQDFGVPTTLTAADVFLRAQPAPKGHPVGLDRTWEWDLGCSIQICHKIKMEVRN